MNEMTFYSIWAAFVIECDLCFIQEIHGEIIISDEGMFSNFFFLFFLFGSVLRVED